MGGNQEFAGCVQLRIESLTGLPVNTAAQWYISYLFPGGDARAMQADQRLTCTSHMGSAACCLLRSYWAWQHSQRVVVSRIVADLARITVCHALGHSSCNEPTMEGPHAWCNLPQTTDTCPIHPWLTYMV